jgi:hypothetical protein
MQNLDAKKILGILACVLIVGLIGAYKLGYLDSITSSANNSNTNQAVYNNQSPSSGSTFNYDRQTVNPNVTTASVNIEAPPLPVNPTRKGVAMLGPSGLYLYIVDTDGRNVHLVKKGLQNELVQENVVDPNDIKTGLKKYIRDMYANGVNNPANVQFITASSTANLPQVTKIISALKEMGVVITMTTPSQEGQWAFNTAVAQQYRDKSILVDITPSITRITWQVGGTTKTVVANVGSKNQSDVSEIRTIISQIPQKQYCFFIWAAAEQDLRNNAPAYSGIPTYNGSDTSLLRGLSIVDTAVTASHAQGIFAWEAGYPMGFLGVR